MQRPKIGKNYTFLHFQNGVVEWLHFVANADGTGGIDPFSTQAYRDAVAALPPNMDICFELPPPGDWREDWARLQREGWKTLAEAIKAGRVPPDFDPETP
ncbi:hypothetical protein [Acanthopleuribacter pedis]|uniref:Uncharacterized protein n=1 Tax=Acanthopleuribacter pedis TaxID=442870 RepID=A0A8J7QC39_9BACT|nr:hypothetical protein [Acanthopleuribacter pedis]MBO1323422.1 hypothetical protein [Acanthopleuribacter pedis]